MIELVIPSLYLLAGVSLYAGISHFSFAMQIPRNRAQLLFSGLCFLVAVFNVAQAGVLQATDVAGRVSLNAEVGSIGFFAPRQFSAKVQRMPP